MVFETIHEIISAATAPILSPKREGAELFESRVMIPGDSGPPADVKATSVERARGLLRGLRFVLAHHDAPKRVIDSFSEQVLAYLDVPEEAVFFKRAKYLTVAPMAMYLKCDAPKSPDIPFQAVGQYRNWANTRLRVFNRRNTHLWYSFLQAKRSALPLSHDLVLTTYKEHREAMGIDDPIDDETHSRVMKELEPVLMKISKALRYVVATDARTTLVERREVEHVASSRACFEKSRAKGGQLGHLMSLAPVLERCNPLNRTGKRIVPDLSAMRFYPWVVIGGVVRHNVVLEEYYYAGGEETWRDAITRETIRYVGGVRLNATIQAVLEPLKVRVISKGEAVPYYISKLLQKKLHGVMRDMACFRLIGRPLCPTDLIDLAENRTILGKGRYEWFSIDYSAATDKLSARLSASIMERLTEGADPDLRRIWLSVLAPHMCRYPFPFSGEVAPIAQRNGQLMGSILSFPILCLANLGLYLANIAEDTRPLKDKLRGVLVNGDDMLYVGKTSLWEDHVRLGSKVGLSMSPGKAYHHTVYANANSACFHFDLYGRTVRRRAVVPVEGSDGYYTLGDEYEIRPTPFSIPFLNSGLYFGQSKVLGGDDENMERSVTSTLPRFMQGCFYPKKRLDLMRMFVSRHSAEITLECGNRNLFAHPSRGGMGVPIEPGFKPNWTPEQLQAADVRGRYRASGFGPRRSPPMEEAPPDLRAPWLGVEKPGRCRISTERGKFRRTVDLDQPVYFCRQRPCNASWAKATSSPSSRFWRDVMREEVEAIFLLDRDYREDLSETLSWLSGFESC
jgi:hypothetical protein